MNLIISCSLNPNSKSRRMAMYAQAVSNVPTRLIDLQAHSLPLCSGAGSKPAIITQWMDDIASARSIIIAGPVYNYDLNAAAKNMMEWTGRAWSYKTVGFLLSAGGKNSFMSPMSFMNSMMLDFRCIIVPRFVYADRSMFTADDIHASVKERIAELVHYTAALGDAVAPLHP